MSEDMKKMLVPSLRFPEFRDAGEWDEKTLKDVCKMQAGKFVSATAILEKQESNFYPCYGGNGQRGFTKSFTHEGKYSLIGRQGALCGNITLALGKFHATEHAIVVSPTNGVDTDWLFFLLSYLNLNQHATGQAQPGLSVENLAKLTIAISKEEKEQQRIADCLSSIDTLLSAQSQKIESLKAHKKGLMQQLFPREGETIPRLRFPEFRDAGEWGEKELRRYLKDHSERVQANTDLPIYSSTRSGLKPQKDYYDDRELANLGEYGVVPNGFFVYRHMSDDGAFKFNINKTGSKIAVSKEYPVFTTLDLHPDFLLHKLNDGNNFKQFALMQKKGGTRTRLYFSSLCSWRSLLPTYKEQQQIADCLSSIDALINAHSQKLDALKTHKQGLMQALFPAADEVIA